MTPSADAGAGGPLTAGASIPSGEPPGPSDDIIFEPFEYTMAMSSDESSTMDLCGNGHDIAFLKLQDSGPAAQPATDFAVKNFSGSSCDGRSNRSNSNSSANTSTKSMDVAADVKTDKNVHWQSLHMSASNVDGRPNNMSQALEPSAAAPWSEIFYDNPLNIASERHSSPPQSSRSRHSPPQSSRSRLSPLMAFTEALVPEKKEQSMQGKQACHKKTKSQPSTTSSVVGRKRGPSCDPSPRSQFVGDGSISPADVFDTSPPDGPPRWSQVGSVTDWAQFLGIQYPPEPEGMPTSINPADLAPATRPMHPPQQMSVSGSPPAYHVAGQHELYLVPTPPKSRVETQIPIKMVLSSLPVGVTKLHLPKHTISKPKLMARPSPDLSPDTLELFVSLVCTSAMEQPALKKKAFERAANTPQGQLPDPDDEENSPQRGGEVRICAGCITRERKRAARKKVKKPDEDRLWSQNEERRVVVFNTHEIKEWHPLKSVLDANGQSEPAGLYGAMQVDAPMRIACYCRHHNEKMGFNVIFTIKDWKGFVVAQTMSSQIMITDDHKTNPVAQQVLTQPPVSSDPTDVSAPVSMFQFHSMQMDLSGAHPLSSGAAFGFSSPTPMMTSSNDHAAAFNSSASGTASPAMASAMGSVWPLSRPPSPSQIGGHPAKKRKPSSPKVPSELVMTQLDANPSPASNGAVSGQASAATSPFAPHPSPFFQGDPLFAQEQQQLQQQHFQQQHQHQQQQHQHQQQQQQQQQQQRSPSQHPHHQLQNPQQMAFVNSPALPANVEMPLFRDRRSESVDNVALMRFCSAPASNQHSRAPSPNSLRNGVGNVSQIHLAQNLGGSVFSMPMQMSSPRALPVIHKIIPNEGPMLGGIEVTVLGESFFQGVEVSFGTVKATTTTYWGPTSLVCLLPPSAVAGLVPVTFGRPSIAAQSIAAQSIAAQSIAAQSFAGKQPPMFKYIDDTEDKIIRTALSVLGHKMSGQLMDAGDLARRILNETTPAWSGGSPAGSSTGGPSFNQASSLSRSHLECQLLNLLDLIDMGDGAHRTRLDMKGPTGHTMLHLACVLGYHRFVAALLARGANANARDRGGFTPLHMAALHNHPEIVKRLVNASANAKIRSLSGLTARDVSPSRAVQRSMRSAKHIRSRSGGSVQSRNGSEASAHSMARNHTLEGPLSGFSREESPEYSSGDFEDEDPDENSHLRMRRPSRGQDRGDSDGATEKEEEEDDDDDDDDDGSGSGSEDSSSGMASNTAAMAAAIKEQIQTQFQQLQQTMALHLQNLANLPQVGMPQMPQMPIFSGMPMLPDYQAYLPQADFMRRMQQLVPGMSGNRGDDAPSPPPSYEDIFPREDMDKKMESAARAAVDAEADLKCSAVYDGASSLKTATTGSQTEARTQIPEIPAVLEIGRKNAITKQQQDNFLRAREQKLKRLSNDPNLFLIWIPLLFIMICGLLYNCFPLLFPFLLTSVRAMVQKGVAWSVKSIEAMADRVVRI